MSHATQRTAAVAVGMMLAATAVPAFAATKLGAGIQAAPVALAGHRGHTYKTAVVTIYNTGSAKATYRLSVGPDNDAHTRPLGASWVHFGHRTVTLKPGRSRIIRLRIAIPKRTARGQHGALIFNTASPIGAGAARVGAASATQLLVAVR